MPILYASFPVAHDAEKAAGALIDQGARSEDISFLASPSYEQSRQALHEEHAAKHQISTTTGSDALMGAAKGLTVGMGLGVIGAIAALAIPGLGLVIGSGAIAAAVTAAAGTAVAGAAAGGVIGFLKDQGLSENQISHYSAAVESGGAILTLTVPSGSIAESQAEGILTKYGASDVSTANPASGLGQKPDVYSEMPITTAAIPQATTVATHPVATRIGTETVTPMAAEPMVVTEVDPLTGFAEPVVPVSSVQPTKIDPITGQILEGFVADPSTGIKRSVRVQDGEIIYMS